jgi:hypothetical protein
VSSDRWRTRHLYIVANEYSFSFQALRPTPQRYLCDASYRPSPASRRTLHRNARSTVDLLAIPNGTVLWYDYTAHSVSFKDCCVKVLITKSLLVQFGAKAIRKSSEQHNASRATEPPALHSWSEKFTTAPQPQAAWVPKNTFSLGNEKEELLWPVRPYTMSETEAGELKDYYRDSLYPEVYDNPQVGARVVFNHLYLVQLCRISRWPEGNLRA